VDIDEVTTGQEINKKIIENQYQYIFSARFLLKNNLLEICEQYIDEWLISLNLPSFSGKLKPSTVLYSSVSITKGMI
jgi:hypothetical protein